MTEVADPSLPSASVRAYQIKRSEQRYILGVVSHVVSPSEFYVHVMTSDDSTDLDDLREQLNDHFRSTNIPPFKLPSDLTCLKGSFWAASYSGDNSWYRVRVLEVLEEESGGGDGGAASPTPGPSSSMVDESLVGKHALVQYVDFGNLQIVPIADLRPLTPELVVKPAMALKCHLAHISGDILVRSEDGTGRGERVWSDEALAHFNDLCGFEQETIVTLHLLNKPRYLDMNHSLPVLLWNNTADENQDILVNTLLVNENLAFTESTEWMEEADRL